MCKTLGQLVSQLAPLNDESAASHAFSKMFHKNRVSLYFIVHYAAKAGPGYSDRLGTKIAGNIENERGPSPGPQDTG